jgi:hypothetical protein
VARFLNELFGREQDGIRVATVLIPERPIQRPGIQMAVLQFLFFQTQLADAAGHADLTSLQTNHLAA